MHGAEPPSRPGDRDEEIVAAARRRTDDRRRLERTDAREFLAFAADRVEGAAVLTP